jgi:hypothetical protein
VRSAPAAAGLSPDTRLVVAGAGGGGGGGGGYRCGGGGGPGGRAGLFAGLSAPTPPSEVGYRDGGGGGGTQTAGGAGGRGNGAPGALGQGGAGDSGGGGGGGYFGGGSGGTSPVCGGGVGGGGGSGYVDAQADFVSAWPNTTGQRPSIAVTFVLRPAAITQPASNVTATSATLHATVNPRGTQLHYRYEYGMSTSYGSITPARSAGAGTSNKAVSFALSPVLAAVTYHYRIVAWNSRVTITGADRTFTTPGRCATPGAITVVARGDLRLYWTTNSQVISSLYACSTQYGRAITLGSWPGRAAPMDAPLLYAWSGQAFAYATLFNQSVHAVISYDLKTAARLRRTALAPADLSEQTRALVVAGDGSMAYIATGYFTPKDRSESIVVGKNDRTGTQVVDRKAFQWPPPIDLSYLRIVGKTIQWKDSGKIRSAPFVTTVPPVTG